MPEYNYTSDAPTWANGYLWPPLTALLERLAPPPAAVFELGCGNGATARMLAGRGYAVTAVDPSASGIVVASRHATSGLRFAQRSTSDDLASEFGRFPIVISLEVIEHCPSALEFMTAFKSVLAPGGVGFISTPYHGWLKNLAIVASGKFDDHFNPLWEGGHLKFFSHRTLGLLFESHGFPRHEFLRVGRFGPFAKSTLAVIHAPS